MANRTETATLAGGCFWCLEAVFQDIRGVLGVVSGYMGGRRANPSYEQVCTGATGHAEVVQLRFDPDVVSYEDLLEVFFAIHDPTTLNRQGADEGTQYRSAIFWHSAEQRAAAEAMVRKLTAEGVFDAPIVTEITPATDLFRAEEYHQDYYRTNPNQGYCRAVIAPKVAKFRAGALARLRKVAPAR
jgi:peptide-methionine (S)-S-oxide reductase